MSNVLVIGFGPVAHRLVERLRHHGHTGSITILGAERRPAYQRALLTSVLTGPLPPDALTLPSLPDDVSVRLGVRAVALDRSRRVVTDDHGTEHSYEHLVIATGARIRDPAIAGIDPERPPPDVRTLRTVEDVARGLEGDVVVVGGGPRGIDVALTLRRRGHRVALVHAHPRPLHQNLDAAAGEVLVDALVRHGVELHTDRRAVAHGPSGLVLRAPDGRRTTIGASTVVLAVGTEPAADLADAGELPRGRRGGVRVDERLATLDPRVHAVGDVAEFPGVTRGSLSAAWRQADVLARRLTGDDIVRCSPVGALVRVRVDDVDLAAAGSPPDDDSPGVDSMIVSDPDGTRYARLDLRDGRLVHASVVGFPHAAGPLGRYWARGEPLPTARLALLLGTPATLGATGPEALPADATVCVCHTVTKGALVTAWEDGAADVDALARATRATTGCGSCRATVSALIDALDDQVSAGGECAR